MRFCRLFFLFLPYILLGWANPGTFQSYPNRYFVETGSFVGDGIQEALNGDFLEIFSITLEEAHFSICQKRFAGHPNVHLFLGDSGNMLEKIIQPIQEPITFWLDAHNDYDELLPYGSNTPILQELEAIKKHPIKTHTILIDDVRLFQTERFDRIPLVMIFRKLLEINPNYRISFIDGYTRRDILVAKLP
jgi:hypothetical protein